MLSSTDIPEDIDTFPFRGKASRMDKRKPIAGTRRATKRIHERKHQQQQQQQQQQSFKHPDAVSNFAEATPILYTRTPAWMSKTPLYYNNPDFQGIDDSSLYNGNKEGLSCEQLFELFVKSVVQVPGAGSILPHLYVPFVAELFFRSLLIVFLFILLWAFFETVWYWALRKFPIPVSWPTKKAIDPETNEEYSYIDHEKLIEYTGLWNPLFGVVGALLAWYSVRLFTLEPFTNEYNGFLVLFFILFFLLAVHQGKNTAWLSVTFVIPVYILGVMAPSLGAYSRGFDKFAPYLFWLISNLWFSLWFVRDPFAGKGKPFFFSLDGTYAWNAFFSVVIFVDAISLWKVIDLST